MHRLKAYATNGFTKTYMHPWRYGGFAWPGVHGIILADHSSGRSP